MKKNNLIIISGPSGAGEDSVIGELKKRLTIEKIITTTTREQRPGEADGLDYYFISQDAFKKGIEGGNYFEYAQHYNDKYYGVTYEEIERVQALDAIGIWKIDYKGVQKAKELFPDIVAILITAPLEILEKRLRERGDVTETYIKERMEYTKQWYTYSTLYDFSVENVQGKLLETVETVEKIILDVIHLDK